MCGHHRELTCFRSRILELKVLKDNCHRQWQKFKKQEQTPYSQFLPNLFPFNSAATTPEWIKFRHTKEKLRWSWQHLNHLWTSILLLQWWVFDWCNPQKNARNADRTDCMRHIFHDHFWKPLFSFVHTRKRSVLKRSVHKKPFSPDSVFGRFSVDGDTNKRPNLTRGFPLIFNNSEKQR